MINTIENIIMDTIEEVNAIREMSNSVLRMNDIQDVYLRAQRDIKDVLVDYEYDLDNWEDIVDKLSSDELKSEYVAIMGVL